MLQDFFANDPFDVTGPVFDDARFFGRRSEAVDIARQLQGGQIKSCLGIRKIGKTSVLTRVLHEVESSHDCLSVVIDCSRDDVWSLTGASLLESIAKSIQLALDAGERKYEIIPAIDCPESDCSVSRDKLLGAVKSVGRPVIIFFDEVDYITPGSPTAPDHWLSHFNAFWRSLRTIYQQCARESVIISLFISGVSSKWFKVEKIGGVENSVLAFIPDEYLSPLSPTASAGMVRSIAKVCGLALDDKSAESLSAYCGHLPYWTRKAGSYLHRNTDVVNRPAQVSQETVIRLTEEFIDVEGAAIAEVALAHLFRVYPEIFKDCVDVMNGVSRKKNERNIATLIRYGVLTVRYGEVILGSKMIEAGLKLYVQQVENVSSLESSPAVKDTHVPRALNLSIDEWADELALINATRNKLEKRLRAVVLNFIKFSSLGNSALGTPSSRLTRCVQAHRAKNISHLPPDDLVEKLLWTELVATIEKEWILFGPIFSDKRLFKEHAEVVNERYDAHAKSADGADLALYRKSLRWLEDAMNRISS